MIKASTRTALGQPMLFLGLSGENVTRLAAGEPIRVSARQMAELGLPQVEVVIHYGKTKQAILDELAEQGVVGRDAADAADAAKRTMDGKGGRA